MDLLVQGHFILLNQPVHSLIRAREGREGGREGEKEGRKEWGGGKKGEGGMEERREGGNKVGRREGEGGREREEREGWRDMEGCKYGRKK